MGTELVPETLYSNELTWLCTREDYIEFFQIWFEVTCLRSGLRYSGSRVSGCLPTQVLKKRVNYIFMVNAVVFMEISCEFYWADTGKERASKVIIEGETSRSLGRRIILVDTRV
jgi:hypothetical protein